MKRLFDLLDFIVENGISPSETLMFGEFNNIFICRHDCGPRVYVSTVILLLPG